MTNPKILFVILSALSLWACAPDNRVACTSPAQVEQLFPQAEELDAPTRKVLVDFFDLGKDLDDFRTQLMAAHWPVAADMGKIRIMQVNEHLLAIEIPSKSPAKEVIQDFVRAGKLRSVEADFATFAVEPQEMGEDDLTAELATLSAPNGVRSATKPVIVAVIDSGVDYTHKDLAPYIWQNPREVLNGRDDDGNGFVDDVRGWNFSEDNNNPMANDKKSYHGTHVAGIVKQAAALVKAGVQIKIMPVKYLDAHGTGVTSKAIRAIEYAVKNGAIVLNNSWGSFNSSQALARTIEWTRDKGVLFVAAAGNGDAYGRGVDLDRNAFYPAAYKVGNIISVAATDAHDRLAPWSNYGQTQVDLAAPGVKIRSARNGNTYAYLSGTSMASPHIAGLAGAVWQLRPDLSYSDIRHILFASVDPIPLLNGKLATGGRANPVRAREMASHYRSQHRSQAPDDFRAVASECLP